MKISIKIKWYDFWIGLFYDRIKKILYFCPFPMIVIIFDITANLFKCEFCDGKGYYNLKDDFPENILVPRTNTKCPYCKNGRISLKEKIEQKRFL